MTPPIAIATMHDPAVAAWDWYRLIALIGLIWAFMLLRVRGQRAPYFTAWRVLAWGVAPTATLWFIADCTVTYGFHWRLLEAIPSWPTGIELALGVMIVGWIAWSYALGTVIMQRLPLQKAIDRTATS